MERRAKSEQTEFLRRVVNTPLTLSTGVAGANLCDMYANLKDRETFVAVMRDRFPHATADLDNPADWANKLAGEGFRQSYISNYVGEAGERAAIDSLQEQGIHAVQAASRTNPDDDLYEVDGAGAWSVKSYEDVDNFHSVVREHPDSTGYVVNSELYEELDRAGEVGQFAARGVEIRDGSFSHAEHKELAEQVVSRMDGSPLGETHDALWDDWPWIASIILLANATISAGQYASGARTRDELIADLGTSLGRLASSSGGAAAGAAVGAALGTAAFPLVGSIIGGSFGAVLGAIGTGNAVRWASRRFRWGDSIRAFELLAERYGDGFSPALERRVAGGFLGQDRIATTLSEERARLGEFEEQLSPSSAAAPSLAAVLVEETVRRLGNTALAAEIASGKVQDSLSELCAEFGIRRCPRERSPAHREARRLFGAFIAESPELLPALRADERSAVGTSVRELERYPNHPLRLSRPKPEILRVLAVAALVQEQEKS